MNFYTLKVVESALISYDFDKIKIRENSAA